MVVRLTLLALALWSVGTAASPRPPPLNNPALLNIGFVCRWQSRCMDRQEQAMKRSLRYVEKYRPPAWKVQVCNRNSGRNGTRKDWIGFSNCIRNSAVRPTIASRQNRPR
jgi:hypothetical protein